MGKKRSSYRARSILYGVHAVVETLRAGRRVVEEVYLARPIREGSELDHQLVRSEPPISHVNESDMRSLAGTAHHQGVAARVGPFPYDTLDSILSRERNGSQVLVLLDSVQDPTNVGSILRSAECLGAIGVVIAKDRAAGITPAVEKASAGASAHMGVARVVNLVRAIDQIKQESFWVYGADASASDTCYQVDLRGNVAFVLGSEESGLRRLVRESCDCCVRIPMEGRIDSLNVAQTTAILLAESLRQRKHAL